MKGLKRVSGQGPAIWGMTEKWKHDPVFWWTIEKGKRSPVIWGMTEKWKRDPVIWAMTEKWGCGLASGEWLRNEGNLKSVECLRIEDMVLSSVEWLRNWGKVLAVILGITEK